MLVCSAGGVLVGTTVAAPVTERIGVPANWAIVACDVGQGDAILLRDPQNPSSTMLIDTGDDVELLDECLSRFGVDRISLLVLTHDDRDHVGALEAVAAISDSVLVSPDSAAEESDLARSPVDDAGTRPLLAELKQRGLPYRVASAGIAGEVGGISWNTIAPPPDELPEDTNAASIVLRVEVDGFSVLLLADTGEDEHRALLAQGVDLNADVVKVAHHGSKDQDPKLLDAIGAEFGLISVGESNGYGHPNSATLTALRQAGTVPVRTDQLGSIAISRDLTGLQAWSTRVKGDP
jgi:competence protein ComEC